MQPIQPGKSKKAWAAPRLITHGTVEKITQKSFGWNDGYISSINVDIGPVQGTITGPIAGGKPKKDPIAKVGDFSFTPRTSSFS